MDFDKWIEQKKTDEQVRRWKRELLVIVGWLSTILFLLISCAILIYLLIRDINYARKGHTALADIHPNWFEIDFPEEELTPHRDFTPEFQSRALIGKNVMKQEKIIFCGLVRDILDNVKLNLTRLEKIGRENFLDYKIVIFENDSKDGTREYLQEIANIPNSKLELVPCHENQMCHISKSKAVDFGLGSNKRLIKMAHFRNRLLNYIKSVHYDFANYVLCLDFDMAGPMSVQGLATNFSFPNWDVMTAFGITNMPMTTSDGMYYYYDTLAFVSNDQAYNTPIRKFNWRHMATLPFIRRGEPPISVKSAFGGAALYKMRSLIESRARYNADEDVCEHVGLHREMAQRGFDKIYVNPSWTLLHTVPQFL